VSCREREERKGLVTIDEVELFQKRRIFFLLKSEGDEVLRHGNTFDEGGKVFFHF
jgi:hypothetical protein